MSFNNCDEAYAAGYANIPRSSPLYAKKLDRDQDGFACDKPPAGFTPHKATETSTGTQVHNSVDNGTLPLTGPGQVGALGALTLVIGAVTVVLVRRRRKVRFVAG